MVLKRESKCFVCGAFYLHLPLCFFQFHFLSDHVNSLQKFTIQIYKKVMAATLPKNPSNTNEQPSTWNDMWSPSAAIVL